MAILLSACSSQEKREAADGLQAAQDEVEASYQDKKEELKDMKENAEDELKKRKVTSRLS